MTIDISRLMEDVRANPRLAHKIFDEWLRTQRLPANPSPEHKLFDEWLRAQLDMVRCAKLLGLSTAHSVLLCLLNDVHGHSVDALARSHRALGDQAPRVLAFWSHLDKLTYDEWSEIFEQVRAADDKSWGKAQEAAYVAAYDAAGHTACTLVPSVVMHITCSEAWRAIYAAVVAATCATHEIQGAKILRAKGRPYFFLPMFGIADPATLEVPA